MMRCKEIEEKLSAYQEGTLSPGERSLVEAHLGTCAQCASAFADLTKTVDLLKDLPEVEPPPWFTQKVMARVREEAEQTGGLLKKLFYPFHVKIPIEAFATLIVVALGVYIYQSATPETKTVFHAPQAEIQQTAPSADFMKEPTKPDREETHTKGSSDSAPHPFREKAFAPARQAERLAAPEQQQKPDVAAPLGAGTAVERKQERAPVAPYLQETPTASPPVLMEKEAPAAAGAVQKDERESKRLRAPQPSKSVLAAKQPMTALSVQVGDIRAAAGEIESILAGLGAQIISRDFREGYASIIAEVQPERAKELLRKLSKVGVVTEKDLREEGQDGNMVLRIAIIKSN